MNSGKVSLVVAFALLSAGGWGMVDDFRAMQSANARKAELEGAFLKGGLEREFFKNLDDILIQHRNDLVLFHSALFIAGAGLASWGFYKSSHGSAPVGVVTGDSPLHEVCSICGTTLNRWQRADGLCAPCKQRANPNSG